MTGAPTFVTPIGDAVLRLSGRDVVPFLQSKLTCDTRRWRIRGGGYGLATDINGKIIFEGRFSLDGPTVVAVVPADLAPAAIEHLDRYVIMEDVAIAASDDRTVVAVSGPDADAIAGGCDPEEPSRLRRATLGGAEVEVFVDPGAVAGAERVLVVAPKSALDAVVGAMVALGGTLRDDAAAADAEVLGGIPRIGRDYFAGETIPLEAGLWQGVSLSKGCYLGQEILERLFSRGSAARRLVRLAWDGMPVAPGTELLVEGEAAGTVTSSAATADGAVGMGWLKRRALAADAAVHVGIDGVAARVVDLVGGPDPESP